MLSNSVGCSIGAAASFLPLPLPFFDFLPMVDAHFAGIWMERRCGWLLLQDLERVREWHVRFV